MNKLAAPLVVLLVVAGLIVGVQAEEKKGLEIGKIYLVLDVTGRAFQGKLVALDKASITIAGKGANVYKIKRDDIEEIREVLPPARELIEPR